MIIKIEVTADSVTGEPNSLFAEDAFDDAIGAVSDVYLHEQAVGDMTLVRARLHADRSRADLTFETDGFTGLSWDLDPDIKVEVAEG